jgi:uncharacterized protein
MNKIGFLIIFAFFASINFYIFTRGRQALPKNTVIQVTYTAIFLILSLSFFIAVLFENKLPVTIGAIFENIGGYWLIVFLYFLVAVLFADLLRLTDHFFHIFPIGIKTNYSQVKLIYFVTVIMILMVFSVIGNINFNNPQTVTLNLNIPKKGEGKEYLTLVAVSDIHLGNLIRKKRLEKYVSLINNQNPDIILIAGDLFDRNLRSVKAQHMDAVLNQLHAKYGVYAVLGNHDYFSNVDSSIDLIARSGIKLLRDSAITIDNKFVLIGRDDFSNRHRKPIKNIISGIDSSLPMILLDHQPVNLNEAVENNIDLQVSGHTHNGQIYPFNYLVAKFHDLTYGYRKTGNTNFYVSSGLGLWGAPIRLGSQSELVKIHIHLKSK